MSSNEYLELLHLYNWTGEIKTKLPTTYVVADANDFYTLKYSFFNNYSDHELTPYYNQDDFEFALDFENKPIINSIYPTQESLVNTFLSGPFTEFDVFFSSVANIKFEQGTLSDSQITIGNLDISYQNFNGNTHGAGATYNWAPGFPYPEGRYGDVWFNQDMDVDGNGQSDWESADATVGSKVYLTVIHELGHAIGLTDIRLTSLKDTYFNSQKYSIMTAVSAPGMDFTPSGLQLLDIAAIQAIYGKNTETRKDDTVYDIPGGAFASANQHGAFLYTIWDGGGTDTIDVSGFSSLGFGAEIDLREGHFSSIGLDSSGNRIIHDSEVGFFDADKDPGNVAIAYGTVIENATGTSHNDRFIGNDANNKFIGGSGADVLDGGAGDDILRGGADNDMLYGGAGQDTADYSGDAASGGTGGVQVALGVNSSYVGVVDGFGHTDQLRQIESLTLTGGNDSVTYDGYNEFSIRHIDGGAGSDTYTHKGADLRYVQQDGDIWRLYNASGHELTLENFETVRFSAVAGYFATLLPDMQDSATPVNLMTSDTGGTTLMSNVDYSAASGNGTYNFGINGQDDNSVSIGGVSQVLRSPLAVYTSNQTNTIDIQDGTSLYSLYTGTGDDTVTSWNSESTIFYSGGDDAYFLFSDSPTAPLLSNVYLKYIAAEDISGISADVDYISIGFVHGGSLDISLPTLQYGDFYSIGYHQDSFIEFSVDSNGTMSWQFYDTGRTDFTADYTNGEDYIQGHTLADTLYGLAGNDTMMGYAGDDALYGGVGDDLLYGGNDVDTLYGAAGNDRLDGGAGDDFLYGGAGDDVYVFHAGGGVDTINDTEGVNTLDIMGEISPLNVELLPYGLDLHININSGVIIQNYYANAPTISQIVFRDNGGSVTHSYTVQQMLNGEHLASNTAPVARDDAFMVNEDTVLNGNVLGDNGNGADSDPDGDAIIVTAGTFATLAGGSVVLAADGSFTYAPAANFHGPDSFTYNISDGQGGLASATVAITVASVNDVPVAQDDIFSGTENQDIAGNLFADNGNGVDYDPDGGVLRLVQEIVVSAAGGSVALMHNGDFVYTPPAGFFGSDSFEYTLSDGQGGEAMATAFIELAPANRVPEAQDDNGSGFILETIGGNVLADNGHGVDSDPDGDSLSVQPASFRTASGGHVVLDGDGDYTYTAVAGFTGTESFTYTLFDGQGGSDTASVTLTVGLRGNEMRGSERGEFLLGTQRSDVILAKGGDDFVLGRQSADKILGGAGKDFIHGQNGDDLLIGGSGSDQLYGGNGNDILIGDDVLMIGSGAGTRYMQAGSGGEGDCLDGGNGNDLLMGGVGNDTLSGGNGADTFKFLSGANGKDRITDFDARDGDKIDISDVLESGYDPLADMISQFAKIERHGHSYTLSVDADGADNGTNFTAIAVFDSNRHLSLETMIQNGNLIV